MAHRRPFYEWFYDNVHSREYDLALRWFLWPFGGERRFRTAMMEPVPFGERERVLDLCCGTASSSLAIRRRAGDAARIVGADLSIGQLRRARPKSRPAGIRLVRSNAAHAPFPSHCFDTVLIPHALHEMPRETRIDVLREARRVVKRDGKVVVLELDDPPSRLRRILLGLWLGYWLPYPLNFENPTRRDMVRRGVVRELREAGFAQTRRISKFEGTMQVVFGWG